MHRTAALLLVAACGSPPAANVTTDTLASGVVQVVNLTPSGWTDTAGIAMAIEHTIAPADSSGVLLSFPLELGTLADGRIVVNDGGGAGILLFRADGTFERVLGRHGDGPGEYGQIFSMAVHASTVYVQECNKARLTRFHLEGDSTSQWPTDDCMSGEGVAVDAAGEIWLDGRLREPSRGVLFRWNAGQRADTFHLPPRQPAPVWRSADGAVPVPFSAYSMTAGNPPLIWSGHGSALAFHRVTADGDTLLISSIPGSAAPISEARRLAAIARFADSPQFASVARLGDVPTAYPLFTQMDLDERGRLWVHRQGPEGTTTHFEVIDSTGIWLGTVTAPVGPGRGHHWANGRMYRIGESATGTPTIEIYRIRESVN